MKLIFEVCVRFLDWLARVCHTTYTGISVIFNIYLQGIVMLVISFILAIRVIVNITSSCPSVENISLLVFAVLQTSGVIAAFIRYRPPLNDAFMLCVHDLQSVARLCHISYQTINVILFVVIYLICIGTSVYYLISL